MLGLLLAICSVPPSFAYDPVAADCPAADLAVPCACPETLQWDPVAEAAKYEVWRTSPSGTFLKVGERQARTCTAVADDDVTCIGWEETPYWLPAWDCARGPSGPGCVFPRLDVTYRYVVRSVNADGLVSAAFSNETSYQRGEWWWCDGGQCRIACHPGPCPFAPGYPR